MKILSWNVNGIRAAIRNGFLNFLAREKSDILCLQETKISDMARVKENFDFKDYEEYWNSAERAGYSGTVVLIKRRGPASELGAEPLKVYNGFSEKEFDKEGRVQTLEFDKFYLINAYFPNANHELSRLNYKLRFNDTLLKYLKKLKRVKPIIICGDFNVAHQEIDLANPRNNINNPGFTYKERGWMDEFLKAGFIDTFRHFYPKKIRYSWWSYRFNARARNIGWRIDYFCASAKMLKYTRPTAQTGVVKDSFILDKVKGSDHCPIGTEIKI